MDHVLNVAEMNLTMHVKGRTRLAGCGIQGCDLSYCFCAFQRPRNGVDSLELNLMNGQTQPVERARIGPFEVNFRSGDLRKNGIRLKVHAQPLEILAMLVSRPGEVVTREEIHERLWPSGTFVDFENGLNSAINRLRTVLGDAAESPKFIETIPRRGYRLIAPVEKTEVPMVATVTEPPVLPAGFVKLFALDRRRWSWIGAAILVLAVTVGLLSFRRFSQQGKPIVQVHGRDWVLITNFDNRTADPIFDGAIEHALERELSNSQFVNIVPRERINDTLRLMRRPLDSKIDPPIGREICLRDGNIRLFLSGRIEKLGTAYVLTVGLVDPASDAVVADINEEVLNNRVAETIHRLSVRVRETLGEEERITKQSDESLARVTTPSLRALQLYTESGKPLSLGSWHGGAELLEQALREDPNFASAHLQLGLLYLNLGRREDGIAHLHRALELADSVTEPERLRITGKYYARVLNDPQKAIKAFETLLQLYPDDGGAESSLVQLYSEQNRLDDALTLTVHFADMNPGDLGANVDAVEAKGVSEQDWSGAQRYLDTATALLAQQGDNADLSSATWLKLLPVYQDWLQGNIQRAHDELVRIEHTSPGLDPGMVGALYGMFGCLQQEAKHYRVWPFTEWAYDSEGLIEFERGNWAEVKTHLRRLYYYPEGTSDSMLMSRVGMWSDVESTLKNASPGPDYQLTAGQLALDQGHTANGIALLEAGLKAHASWPVNAFFLGSESLAKTYEKQRRFDDALRILLQASAAKSRVFGRCWPAFWLRTQLRLADLYRTMGRVSEAEKLEGDLRKMLVFADADHPIVLALQKRSSSRVIASKSL